MQRSKFVIGVIAGLALSACGHEHKKSKPTPQPTSVPVVDGNPLPMPSLTHAYFDAYDQSQPCEAVQEFVTKYVELYAKSAQVKDIICRQDPTFSDGAGFYTEFSISKDSKSLIIPSNVIETSDGKRSVLSPMGARLMADISPEFAQFTPTWKKFFEPHPELSRIFGLTYAEFVAKAKPAMEAKGIDYKGSEQTYHLAITLHEADTSLKKGTVMFRDVPQELLKEGVLGCKEAACLDDGSMHYIFYRNHLTIWREKAGGAPATTAVTFSELQDAGLE